MMDYMITRYHLFCFSSETEDTPKGVPAQGKTWLDDATISSEQPKPEAEGGQENPESAGAADAPETPTKDESGVETPVVVNLADLADTDIEITLPNLICPSSEIKSREYGVRQWLKTTSFPCAIRTTPLL